MPRSHRLGNVAIVLLAAYLSLLVAYRFSIQQDFEKAWRNRAQSSGRTSVQQVPDLTDGTLILVTRQSLPTTHFIETNSWADPIVLPADLRVPSRLEDSSAPFRGVLQLDEVGGPRGGPATWQVPAATWECPLGDPARFKCRSVDNGKRHPGPSIRIHQDAPADIESEALVLPAPRRLWLHGALYPLLISAGHGSPARRREPNKHFVAGP